LVELASRQGRVRADVSSLRSALGASLPCGARFFNRFSSFSANLSLGNTSLLWRTVVVEKQNILSSFHQVYYSLHRRG
jgi:hypothetical protein